MKSPRVIGYRVQPPLKIFLAAYSAALIFSLYVALVRWPQIDMIFIMLLLSSLLMLIYMSNRGYRVAWDDSRVYMRKWGYRNLLLDRHPWTDIEFNKIHALEGKFRPQSIGLSSVVPYEYIEISSTEYGKEPIIIHPMSMNEGDLKQLLDYIKTQRPDLTIP